MQKEEQKVRRLMGKVVRRFPSYGFIRTPEGDQYYFHNDYFVDPGEAEKARLVKFTPSSPPTPGKLPEAKDIVRYAA